MIPGVLVDLLLGHSEALAITVLGLYIAYEIRVGAMREVRANQRTLGVALYRVIQRHPELDEEEFRRQFWDSDDDKLMASDLDVTRPPDQGGG